MNKNVVITMFLLLTAFVAASAGTIRLSDNPTVVELLQCSANGLTVRYNIEKLNFSEVQTPEGVFAELGVEHYAYTNKEGLPSLPLMRQIISVPVGAEVVPSFSLALRQTVSLKEHGVYNPVVPRQASVSKSTDPSTVPFVVNRSFYNGRQWTSEPSLKVEEIGFMRGVRLFALDFVPVRYNPGSGEIEVIYSAEVEVRFPGADHAATQDLRERTWSPAFEGVYSRMLLNPESTRVSLNRYPMSYVVITPDNFLTALQPFIDWKTREGFNMIVATTAETGTTTNSIKTYMQNLWAAATTENPAPSYLLIVGDVAQVPSNNGTTGSHVTDLPYVRLEGTDFVPEMYFGRFSATTPAEVTNQVNKTMLHEQYTMPSDAYLGDVVMIAGVDSYYSSTHANGQINYGTNNYFNAAHGINSFTYLYPASGSSDAQIVANVSAGVGYVNYTAHGSTTSWADPTFTIQNINSLQNANEYPVVVGNCCLTSAFNTGVCFGEAWLRAENKGAVIYIGGTNSTYWDEDYWWGVGWKPPVVGTGSPFVPNRTGAYDAMFHDHDEPFADWANNVGAAAFMGNMAVVQSNSSRINYYWEIYSVMGDPSLIPYLGIPADNSAQAPATMFLGINSMDIAADPYSYVALSMNNVLHGTGLADASGNLTLNFTPFTEPGTAQLVITRSLRKPLIANVQVVPNTGPYVTVSPINFTDPNSNGIAEAGETISLNLTFNNVGIAEATNLTVTIATTNEYVTLLNSSATIANVPAGGSITVDDIFSVAISPMIPDQDVVAFTITVSDGTNAWVSERSLTVNAPWVELDSITMVDNNGNGFMEPGEIVNITLNITNTGHMPADSGILTLVVNNPSVTLNMYEFTLPAIAVGANIPLSFVANLGADLQTGDVVVIGAAITAGAQLINQTILIPIGMIGENFESGDFSSYSWQNNSAIPWTVQSGTVHGGSYAAKSGTISHNSNTELSLTLLVGAEGSVSFWRKVSSEVNYDWLRFSIDGVEMGSWSGNQDWAQFTYPVSPGTRLFKWVYSKDVSVNSGSDCAWIDDIVFPSSGSGSVAMIYVPTQSIDFLELNPGDNVSADFVVRNLGNVDLSGMISAPAGFSLSHNGNPLPNDYNYSIPVGGSKIYTLSYLAPNPVVNMEAEIIITSNDQDNPAVIIPVHVGASPNSDPGVSPLVTELEGNYPNPFNPETVIRFSVKEASRVRINIYNLKGQLVRSLLDSDLEAGNHRLVWNGKDNGGRSVSSGIYLYRMVTPSYSKSLKMMLMK